MLASLSLPDAIRRLRFERELSVGELAHRAGLSINSIHGWESGRQVPKGSSLARLLDALEAPDRLRSRLIAEADPRFARVALAKTRLGPPLSAGAVLRAMRARRGSLQADLALALGVSQGTVARWETGELIASASTLHEAAFALGATVEEAIALASAQGTVPLGLPDAPTLVDFPLVGLSLPLQEIILLTFEAELWRRASHDGRWEPSLCKLLSLRANHAALQGRFAEIPELAERALRLASTPEARTAAVPAVNALSEYGTRRGQSPGVAARLCGEWAERIPDSIYRAWMLGSQALNLARVGRESAALDHTRQARDMDAAHMAAAMGEFYARRDRAQSEAQVALLAGRPDLAAAHFLPFQSSDAEVLLGAEIEHANGHPLGEAALAYLRYRVTRLPSVRSWKNLRRLEAVEFRQAELTGEPPAPVFGTGSLDYDEDEAQRLWSAIPGDYPWIFDRIPSDLERHSPVVSEPQRSRIDHKASAYAKAPVF